MGNKIKVTWTDLGPMPTDPDLERKLDRVKYENNHTRADEAAWLARIEEDAETCALAEQQFLRKLDKETESD